jgi:iron complex transport system ATP-binding protein
MPHLGPGAVASAADLAAIDRAITRMGLDAYRTRRATELSGGEQARALIARALAQEAPLLLADEPTAGLDPAAQIGAMEVFSTLACEGQGALVSLHDLGLAARSCTRLVVMHRGRIVADGIPADVLSPPILAEVFGITAHLATGSDGLIFQPLRRL